MMVRKEICKLYEFCIPETSFLTSNIVEDIRTHNYKQSHIYVITNNKEDKDIYEIINDKSKGYLYLWGHKDEYKPLCTHGDYSWSNNLFHINTSINMYNDAIWERGFVSLKDIYGMQLLLIEK